MSGPGSMTSQKPQEAGPTALLIAGPTASGKSALAIAAARALNGVVINADASQIYADLRILSARPTAAEEAAVPHRLFGFVPGAERYSVAAWLKAATAEIERARAGGRVPILVGGTGLYFKALLEGLAELPPIPDALRKEAAAIWDVEGAEGVHRRLEALDPEAAARLAPADRTRRVRALEVAMATGKTLKAWQAESAVPGPLHKADIEAVALLPEREALYRRCDERFLAMLEAGALEEVAALLARRLDPALPVMKAVGVRELGAFLGGTTDREGAVAAAQARTRAYAKRQMTWIRGQMAAWPKADPQDSGSLLESIVRKFQNSG